MVSNICCLLVCILYSLRYDMFCRGFSWHFPISHQLGNFKDGHPCLWKVITFMALKKCWKLIVGSQPLGETGKNCWLWLQPNHHHKSPVVREERWSTFWDNSMYQIFRPEIVSKPFGVVYTQSKFCIEGLVKAWQSSYKWTCMSFKSFLHCTVTLS